jgi:hypothetical protein
MPGDLTGHSLQRDQAQKRRRKREKERENSPKQHYTGRNTTGMSAGVVTPARKAHSEHGRKQYELTRWT